VSLESFVAFCCYVVGYFTFICVTCHEWRAVWVFVFVFILLVFTTWGRLWNLRITTLVFALVNLMNLRCNVFRFELRRWLHRSPNFGREKLFVVSRRSAFPLHCSFDALPLNCFLNVIIIKLLSLGIWQISFCVVIQVLRESVIKVIFIARFYILLDKLNFYLTCVKNFIIMLSTFYNPLVNLTFFFGAFFNNCFVFVILFIGARTLRNQV